MRILLTLLCLLTILVLPACDSPTDVEANRFKSIDGGEDDPDFSATAERLFQCPGSEEVLIFVMFYHEDLWELEDDDYPLRIFHEHADIEVIGDYSEHPTLVVTPGNPDGSVEFPISYYATMKFAAGTSAEERLNSKLRVVAGDRFATTIDIRQSAGFPAFGEGIFTHDFGAVELGQTGSHLLSFCQHCPGAWILESIQLDDPAGLLSPEFPTLPHRIERISDFRAVVNFQPRTTGDFQATMTMNFRTESGHAFQSVYNYSGSGE